MKITETQTPASYNGGNLDQGPSVEIEIVMAARDDIARVLRVALDKVEEYRERFKDRHPKVEADLGIIEEENCFSFTVRWDADKEEKAAAKKEWDNAVVAAKQAVIDHEAKLRRWGFLK